MHSFHVTETYLNIVTYLFVIFCFVCSAICGDEEDAPIVRKIGL